MRNIAESAAVLMVVYARTTPPDRYVSSTANINRSNSVKHRPVCLVGTEFLLTLVPIQGSENTFARKLTKLTSSIKTVFSELRRNYRLRVSVALLSTRMLLVATTDSISIVVMEIRPRLVNMPQDAPPGKNVTISENIKGAVSKVRTNALTDHFSSLDRLCVLSERELL